MPDVVVSLTCGNCGKPATAKLCGPEGYVGSACCDGELLRRLTDRELEDIYEALDADENAERSRGERARLRVMGEA